MERVINFFPPERHRQIYLQLSLNLRAVISQRLVKSSQGGRAAAIEVLLASPRVKELIKKGEVDALKEAMAQGANDGMQTFDHALFELYRAGRITLADALENADSATDLKLKIKLHGTADESTEAPSVYGLEAGEA